MTTTEQVEQMLNGIKPLLMAQDKDIRVVEATEEKITLSLIGFCGGCGCSENYAQGLKEMIEQQFPNVKEIAFEMN